MSKLSVKPGSKKETVTVFIQDSSVTTGAGLTGLVFDSAGLSAYYSRQRGAATAITLATLAAATSNWTSGGFKEISAANMPGVYRLDLPDAALTGGSRYVSVMLKGATNMAPCLLEIDLNLQGSLSQLTTPVWSGTAQAGSTINTIVLDTGASATDNAYRGMLVSIPAAGGVAGGVAPQTANIVSYVGSTRVATVDRNWGGGTPTNTTTFDILAAASSQLAFVGQATGGSGTTIVLPDDASAEDDFYNGWFFTILSGTGAGGYSDGPATDYDGGTLTVTVDGWSGANPDATSVFAAVPPGANVTDGGTPTPPPSAGEIAAATMTSVVTQDYAADGAEFTPAQALYMIWSFLTEKAGSGTTVTCKKLNGSTTSMTFTLDSATQPTSLTRAT